MSINAVAPLAGAWIEISVSYSKSHQIPVAPLAGAWIEIQNSVGLTDHVGVAPLAGAWIEMFACIAYTVSSAVALLLSLETMSLPSRERGLKFLSAAQKRLTRRRSPRGSVD